MVSLAILAGTITPRVSVKPGWSAVGSETLGLSIGLFT